MLVMATFACSKPLGLVVVGQWGSQRECNSRQRGEASVPSSPLSMGLLGILDTGIDEEIILKWILGKWAVSGWTHLKCLGKSPVVAFSEHGKESFQFLHHVVFTNHCLT
jgi:hypothetical protein